MQFHCRAGEAATGAIGPDGPEKKRLDFLAEQSDVMCHA